MVDQYAEWQRLDHRRAGGAAGAHASRYGIVAGTAVNDRMMDLTAHRGEAGARERRTIQLLGVAGRYILTPGIFREIANLPRGVGGEIQLTDGIAALMRREKVFAYRYDGRRYDCGSKEGFLEANVELALAHPAAGCRASASLPEERSRSRGDTGGRGCGVSASAQPSGPCARRLVGRLARATHGPVWREKA